MAETALALYVIGVLSCFGGRTWAHHRATGDSGFRRPPRRPGTAAWWSAVLFALALMAGLAGPVLDVLEVLEPVGPMSSSPLVGWIGLVVAAAGFVGTLVAQQAMGTSWRIGVSETERTALVRTGVFRWSRNPIFLAMIVALLGLSLAVPNPVQLVALVSLVVAIELQVRRVEEPYLRRTHRAAYADYASRVGRFLPGVGLLPPEPTGGSSDETRLGGNSEPSRRRQDPPPRRSRIRLELPRPSTPQITTPCDGGRTRPRRR